jgi:hypothetical protein
MGSAKTKYGEQRTANMANFTPQDIMSHLISNAF